MSAVIDFGPFNRLGPAAQGRSLQRRDRTPPDFSDGWFETDVATGFGSGAALFTLSELDGEILQIEVAGIDDEGDRLMLAWKPTSAKLSPLSASPHYVHVTYFCRTGSRTEFARGKFPISNGAGS